MDEIINFAWGFIGGWVLGIFFFGGLWWTVNKAIAAKKPGFWFIGSFLVRTSITVFGFYYLSQGSWQTVLFGILGFLIARHLILHSTKPSEEKQIQLKKKPSKHEAQS
ncbi:hypothetical protein P872_18920 [Rhodonellum psychrophilum GCM71 = DSM 17998]|uniref:ATPase F0F1 n=2 Tax=Rhodonellum TaxID=336827 RepID=U5C250_9BACT|nr:MULTISPECIES: ATP synthase subunit I [Rhodonellum]ERM82257.1 hypothetical protein P872_18920 [Rhodonellum psychrophilum GCM71 = DSM 17998]MDO9551360.1 ATP synthase subunit I [Rhodonellum sp.]SDZ25759.1 F1/F0 ATPase, subunit 2 [Rhodonellum ikkaensis]